MTAISSSAVTTKNWWLVRWLVRVCVRCLIARFRASREGPEVGRTVGIKALIAAATIVVVGDASSQDGWWSVGGEVE
jgi:hypothetical protein